MNPKLHPLKFKPQTIERVWGTELCLISGFQEDSSIVAEGYLQNNALFDIIDTYMTEIMGEEQYKFYGNEFPILVKELDLKDRLSIQIHPDNETAFDLHNSYGKSEAWYVLDAAEDAALYLGLKEDIDPSDFYNKALKGDIEGLLNVIKPKKGDFLYIEAGTIHSAKGHIQLSEIQQLSDITYRLYDWDKERTSSYKRELHLETAFGAINYKKTDLSTCYFPAEKIKECGDEIILTDNNFFNTTYHKIKDSVEYSKAAGEKFALLYCIAGAFDIEYKSDKLSKKIEVINNEWILVPASISNFTITPKDSISELLWVSTPDKLEDPLEYLDYKEEQ